MKIKKNKNYHNKWHNYNFHKNLQTNHKKYKIIKL